MIKITHALKFASKAESLAALAEFTVDTDDGPVLPVSHWDVIGTIYKQTGTDPETGEAIMEALEGFHINVALPELRADLPGLVGAWEVPGVLLWGEMPVTPQRVFA